mmetsp:Transcript_65883/g.204080  ORF Transcript_65883/g.204080 Transcript_65883/m.204080 type:complete len:599 (+) Transcript_65883:72-1868(+)
MPSTHVRLLVLTLSPCARHALSSEAASPDPGGRAVGADAEEPEWFLTKGRYGPSSEAAPSLACTIGVSTGDLEPDCTVQLVQTSRGRLLAAMPSPRSAHDLSGFHPQAPNSGPGGATGLWRFLKLPLALATSLTIAALITMKWYLWSSSPVEAVRCMTKGAHFVITMGFTICIVDSYRMARLLNLGPGMSGLLVGCFCNGHAFGVLVMWSLVSRNPTFWRTRARPIIMVVALLYTAGCAMYLACLVLVAKRNASHVTLPVVLYFSRFVMGLPSGLCVQWISVCFKSVSTREEFGVHMGHVLLLVTIGIGAGPLVASAAHALTPTHNCPGGCPPSAIAAHAAVQLVFAVGVLAAVLACFPRSSDLPEPAAPADEDSLRAPPQEEKGEEDALPRSQRTCLIWCCIGIFVVRCFVVAGVEAGSCLILERDFHWPPANIGLAVGITFLCIIPIRWLTAMATSCTVTFQFRVFSLLGLVGAVLLLRKAAELVAAPGWLFVLFSDVLIFSGAYLCDTLTFPLALQYSFAANESWLNVNTVAMVSQVIGGGAGRLLGPWLARLNLETFGRMGQDMTAVVQMILFAAVFVAFELGIGPALARGKGP